jgi:photosystem II stability/assembly factor-like uncharacterized protein
LTAHNVEALLLDVRLGAPTRLYAGMRGSGIAVTEDDGATWDSLLGGATVRSIVKSYPEGGPAIYAATRLRGVLKTTDNGQSWQEKNAGLPTANMSDLTLVPGSPGGLYAATYTDGVFKSTDGGDSWIAASTGLTVTDVRALAVHPLTTTTLYAGTDGGIFKSTDGGSSWSFSGLTGPGNRVEDIVFDPVDPDVAYAVAGDLHWTEDGGGSWTEVMGVDGGTDLDISAFAEDVLYVATTSGLEQVHDPRGAQEVTKLTEDGLLSDNLYAVVFDWTKAPGRIYVGSDGGSVHAYDLPWRAYLPIVLRPASNG